MPESSLKDQGNDEFKKGNFLKAAGLYSKAIKEDPDNAVLYSNRCAALLKLNKVGKALDDAEHCIRLKPDWDKGYFRKGSALEASQKYKEALLSYQEALKKNSDNSEVSSKIRTLTKFIRTLDKQPTTSSSTNSKTENGSKKSLADAKPAQAGPAPHADIETFRQEWLEHVLQQAADPNLEASIHFLPGQPESVGEEELNVKAKSAFDSPDVFGQFCGFLSSHKQKLAARALSAILPKGVVSFPAVWKRAGWPCGQDDGVFFQTMAEGYKQMIFIPVHKGKLKTPVELDSDFAILPWSLIH